METERGMTAPSVIAISWLAASAAIPLALVVAACGQGVGALVGGCQWIGIALPLDRQVWALVNQPVLNFAALPTAGGYWLGSTILPLFAAATIIGFLPRPRSLVAELVSVQVAWALSTIAVAWLPLVDHDDGHVVRFLSLHGFSSYWIWLTPGLASAVALLPTLRLLELARRRSRGIGRTYRLGLVAIHLGLPVVLWCAVASAAHGFVPVLPTIAVAIPLVAVVVLAWFRYPSPHVHPLAGPKIAEVVALAGAAAILSGGVWLAGRPLAEGTSAGVLWGQPGSFNNIRPWINPWPAKGDARAGPNDRSGISMGSFARRGKLY
ncbi:MAG: hypothetical protein PVG92_03650 [Holophagae bacterium]